MKYFCDRCYGQGVVRDPASGWWKFWKTVQCNKCNGSGGYPKPSAPPPPPPPPAPTPPKVAHNEFETQYLMSILDEYLKRWEPDDSRVVKFVEQHSDNLGFMVLSNARREFKRQTRGKE